MGTWGIAERQVQRLYFANVTYGRRDHLFVVAVASWPRRVGSFGATAQRLLDTVQVSVSPS